MRGWRSQSAMDIYLWMALSLSRRPATERLYQQLREWVLATPPGERLGSESEILARFMASRPTFRQAASLLESEHLIKIRRGNGGGYYASRPTAAAATLVTANYCRSLQLPREEVIAAWMPIRAETVRLAARDRGARAREELEAFIAELHSGKNGRLAQSGRRFAQTVRRFNALLALLADNRLLSLFYEILHESNDRFDQEAFYRRRPGRIVAYRRQMLALAEAIAAGEEAKAENASRRCVELNLQWAAEEAGRRSRQAP